MREIKFRGRGPDTGGWVYGEFLQHSVPRLNYYTFKENGWHDVPTIYSHTKGQGGKYHVVFAETVGEYTGLKDKNGREIYKGDIVKDHSDPMGNADVGIVVYVADRAMFAIRYYGGTEECITYGIYDCKQKELEVIGNIHDNPELLKQE